MSRARARSTDPESSHIAASEAEDSGSAARQRATALRAVRQFPGNTSKALALITGIDRYVLARRLPELREDGLILSIDDHKGLRWEPIPTEETST